MRTLIAVLLCASAATAGDYVKDNITADEDEVCVYRLDPAITTVGAKVAGTFTATILADGYVYETDAKVTIDLWAEATRAGVQSVTAAGNFIIPAGGYAKVCLRADEYTSGTATVSLNASASVRQQLLKMAADGSLVVGDGTGALNVIVDSITAGATIIGKVGIDQTTPGTTNLVQITDGSGAVNAIIDSGSVTAVQTTATSLKAEVIGAGTAGTANAGVLTIQGIASMTPVLTTPSQATAANLNAQVQGSVASAGVAADRPLQLGAYAEADGAALVATGVVEADITNLKATLDGELLVSNTGHGHPNRIHCFINTTATTSTLITGCSAPGAGLSIYITDIMASQSGATVAANALTVQSGTGGTCGAATTVIRAVFVPAMGGFEAHLVTPTKLTTVHEVCILSAEAGNKTIEINGFIAP